MQEQSGARSLAGRGHMHCRYYSIVWSALCLAFLLCSNTAVAGAAGSNMVRNFAGGVTNQLAFVKPSSFPLIGRRAPKPEGSLAEEAHAFLVSSSTGERIALSAAATMATRILLGDWNQTGWCLCMTSAQRLPPFSSICMLRRGNLLVLRICSLCHMLGTGTRQTGSPRDEF